MGETAPESISCPDSRALTWILPNLSAWLWLILFLFLIADPQRTKLVSSDGDANMHWRLGEYMLETKQVIRTDVFSHTRFGAPIVSKEWLAQILFALAGRMGGLTGLTVLAAIMIASTFALLHRQLVREGADLLVATLLVLIAAWASVPHWHARPHVFSFLMLLLWDQAIRRFERRGRAAQLAVSLSILMILWVNLHGGYLAGFIVLGCSWLAAAIEWCCADAELVRSELRRRLSTLTWVGFLCAAVSLLNPSGYHLHIHNFQVVRSSFVVDWFDEYSSNNFQELNSLGFLVWLAALFSALVLCRPRLSVGKWFVLGLWGYFALYAARNVSFFVILSAPILASVFSEAPRPEATKRLQNLSARITRIDSFNRGWITVFTIGTVVVLIAFPVTSMPSRSWPVAAVEFIQKNRDQFSGNMFNLYGWGGYLMRVLPSHKVFVPQLGRADSHGGDLMKDYDELDELRPRWREVMERYDIQWTLLPANHRLNQALSLQRDWNRVYIDEVAAIYYKAR